MLVLINDQLTGVLNLSYSRYNESYTRFHYNPTFFFDLSDLRQNGVKYGDHHGSGGRV
jgi:hypothetical protein